jgi:GDP-L-fucose synthase
MANVLVTGGSGMLGRHLVPLLEKSGHIVYSPNREELDLTDSKSTLNYLKTIEIDAVIHCAAYVSGIASNTTTKHHSFDSNVMMGLNLIRGCVECGVKNMINVGSSTAYPNDAPQPLREESLGDGAFEESIEGYALSKYVVYRACVMANEQHGVSFKTVHPCNLFGPYDNFSLETGHMLPAILHRMHKAKGNGNAAIVIWGDGTAKREFLYAPDLADFLNTALTKFSQLPEVMNVGSGVEVSVNEMHQHMAKVIGYNGELQHDLSRPVGRKRRHLELSKQKELGWSPKTQFEEALVFTYEYLRGTLE